MDTIFTCSGMSWMIGLSVESYCSLNLFSPISFAIIEEIVAVLIISTSIQTNVLRLMVDIDWVASKYHRNIYCASTGWMVNDDVFQCILGLLHTSMESSSLFIAQYIHTRRSVPSTDQAIPCCFYFRISWILME